MAVKPILFYISHGHRQPVGGGRTDPGAVSGKFIEADLAYKLCKYIKSYLLANRGKMTYKVAYPEYKGKGMHLWEHVQDIARRRLKYRTVAIDVHFNAGGGVGCECWIPKNNKYSEELAKFILAEQKKIGRPWHSYNGKMAPAIHKDSSLQFLKAKGPTLLFEVGYVDNKTDRKDFDTDRELKEIAEAVGEAMIRYYKKYR